MSGTQQKLLVGDEFTIRLQAATLEEQKKKIDVLEAEVAKAVEIGEELRDWLAYGCNVDDARLDELAAMLEKIAGPRRAG